MNIKYPLTKLEVCMILFAIALTAMLIFYALQFTSKSYSLAHEQRTRIADLELQVYELKRLNDYVPAMQQLFTPLALDELKALSEQIRQQKQ